MIILTDGQYSGLPTQVTGIPNYNCTTASCGGFNSLINPTLINPATGENYLTQGSVQTKNSPMSLDGFDKTNVASSMPAMDQYTGVLVWQDRRNSTDIVDNNGNVIACYINCGANTPTAAQYQANNVTATSPGLSMTDGLGALVLNGAIYQPRGAWYSIQPGNAGITNSPLMIMTGALICGNGSGTGCGNTATTLLGPVNNIITYLPVLIQ